MRLFEIIIYAAIAVSIVNIAFIHNKPAGTLLSVVAAVATVTSIIFEGYRLFMVPAYLIALVLLIMAIVRSIRYRRNVAAGLRKAVDAETYAVSSHEPSIESGFELRKPVGAEISITSAPGLHKLAGTKTFVSSTPEPCKPVSAKNSLASSPKLSKPAGARALKVVGTTLLALIYIATLALNILLPVVNLPRPSGIYSVGTTLMAFTDTSRTYNMALPTSTTARTGSTEMSTSKAETTLDSGTSSMEAFAPAAELLEYRNIPVQIWYPASEISGKQRARWMASSEMSRLFAECKNIPDILGQLTLIKTNSYVNAGLSEKEEKYPVILFSGGGAMFNGQNVIQMEELASHGYIVCAVGHPYDDFACQYPDGTILPYSPEHLEALGKDIRNALEASKQKYGEDGNNPEFINYTLHNSTLNNADAIKWSEDMSFVADQLTKLSMGEINDNTNGENHSWYGIVFAGRLDMERLGIFGHSFGGAASGEACLRDSRFKAFINMDGTPFGTAVDNVISQPFMILTTGKEENKVISKGYAIDQKNYLSVYLEGAEHMNFTDFNAILPNVGRLTGLLGNIDRDRNREIINSYILSFFNEHLKEMPSPLLDSSTSEYPEVLVEVE